MSSNREIPQRVIVADQVNGSAVDIVARGEGYFDSVTPEGAGDLNLYGGGIFSYYAEGDVVASKVAGDNHAGKLMPDLDITDIAVLTTPNTTSVIGAAANGKVQREGFTGFLSTDSESDNYVEGFSAPSFDNIVSVNGELTSIYVNGDGGTGLKVGDAVTVEIGSNGIVEFTITKELLQVSAGYHEAIEDQETTLTVPAGTPVYGRFSKITIPSGTNIGSVVITNG